MSSGLRESRSHARRQRRKRMAKWLFVAAIFVGLGAFAYQTGSVLAEREVVRLRDDLAAKTRTVDELRHENAALRTAADDARRTAAEWHRRYTKDVPTGTRKALLTEVEQQMAAGVKAERLRFLIGAAAHQRACSGQPLTKRFLVRTPIATGPVSAVTFADGAITVTAEGAPALDPQGRPLAVFDPAQPITVRFTALSGAETKATGTLPLQHAMVVNDSEYRFNITDGERRGFLQTTADRCDFPTQESSARGG